MTDLLAWSAVVLIFTLGFHLGTMAGFVRARRMYMEKMPEAIGRILEATFARWRAEVYGDAKTKGDGPRSH